MRTEFLNAENLVELHEQLNDFAEHYKNIGGKDAYKLVQAIWDESKANPRNGSPDGLKFNEGLDSTFKHILSELRKKFIL